MCKGPGLRESMKSELKWSHLCDAHAGGMDSLGEETVAMPHRGAEPLRWVLGQST